jgi:hypothetical protein
MDLGGVVLPLRVNFSFAVCVGSDDWLRATKIAPDFGVTKLDG